MRVMSSKIIVNLLIPFLFDFGRQKDNKKIIIFKIFGHILIFLDKFQIRQTKSYKISQIKTKFLPNKIKHYLGK